MKIETWEAQKGLREVLERYLARVAFLAPNIKEFRGKNSSKKRPKDTSEIVIHRQLQVSTGSGGALKPLFTGPYIVNSIDKDRSSASLEPVSYTHLTLPTNREV